MIQRLKEFFSQRIQCDRDCFSLERELECVREDLREAHKSLIDRDFHIQDLIHQITELHESKETISETCFNLEKEIDLLRSIVRSRKKHRNKSHNFPDKQKPREDFVVETIENT